MACLFCNGQELNYSPAPNMDFICSSCVQLLLSASQEDLKRAHAKALSLGYQNKARAIESFLIPEGKDEQRKPESKKRRRYTNRKRITKFVRDQKERIKRVAV
jgi:hypothetical protein